MGKFDINKLLNRLRFGRDSSGPYRFSVRNWGGITDIDLLSRALATETFRANIKPEALSLDGLRRILVLAPHQDDELIGAGGLMIAARDNGIPVTISFLTNGAQKNLKFRGKTLSPSEAIIQREVEARLVCDQLNAHYHGLGIDNMTMDVNQDHVKALARLMKLATPDVVLVPWLFDGSPKHRVACQILCHALDGLPDPRCEVWGYQVNNTPFANGYFDITGMIDEKRDLLGLYVSQNEALRRYDHLAQGLGAWNSRFMPSKTGHEKPPYAEIFFALPGSDFCTLVHEHYPRDFAATYLGKTALAGRMANLHRDLA